MIEPVLRDEALLESIRATNACDGEFRLWWLGQSGFLLQWNRHHLLIDPYLSDSLTKKYAGTATPHIRMTAIPVNPDRLNFIGVVTASHIHTDHLDPETLRALLRANSELKLVVPEAERVAVDAKLSVPWPATFGVTQECNIELDDFRISGIASAHERVELDALGRCRFLGYVLQFGGWTVYHSGDTVLHPSLPQSLTPFGIDVALLPINGRDPKRGVAGNLNAQEAAWLGHEIKARVVIPCHYDMFTFNTASVEDFAEEAQRVKQRYHVLRCGERWDSSCLKRAEQSPRPHPSGFTKRHDIGIRGSS